MGTPLQLPTPAMVFSAPATPLPLDLDNDGFIDTVYMGDMGGNMWRFRLCPRDPVCYGCGLDTYYDDTPLGYTDACGTCDTSNWSGSLLYQTTAIERGSGLTPTSNSHKQIFTVATATKDASGNVWVYFGTGENNDPTVKPTDTTDTKNRIFGIKDTAYNRYGASSSCAANTTSCTGRRCSGRILLREPLKRLQHLLSWQCAHDGQFDQHDRCRRKLLFHVRGMVYKSFHQYPYPLRRHHDRQSRGRENDLRSDGLRRHCLFYHPCP